MCHDIDSPSDVITSIKPARTSGLYTVTVGDDHRFVIDEALLLSMTLRVGDRVSQSTLERLKTGSDTTRARSVSLRFLSVRARSEKEIRRRLAEEDLPSDICDETILWLERLGYVNDRRFAEDWVRHRRQSKSIGSRRLRYELFEKGLESSIIEEVISDLEDDDEYTIALQAATKRYDRLKHLESHVATRRLYGYLQRRGFPSSIIRQVMTDVKMSPEVDNTDYRKLQ